jgi:prepilin-type N-terminal cleavage/methylation domain-containing protein
MSGPDQHMNSTSRLWRDQRGFTLIEMMLVVLIMGTLAAMAVVVGPSFAKQARADSGTVQLLEVLRTARETAIGQRRNIQIRFLSINSLETAREEIAVAPAAPVTTVLRTLVFENRVQLVLVPGLGDTPDGFGGAPLSATAFGPTPSRAFTSEGTLIDANGDVLNGTIFMSIPNVPNSARAVTIFGTTGLMRTWRWNGAAWVE